MSYSIHAYTYNREKGQWCGGVFENGIQPILDSATLRKSFSTRQQALEWARKEKQKLLKSKHN